MSQVTDELKPCPFCGERADMFTHSGQGPTTHYIACMYCSAEVSGGGDKDKAVEAWNRRSTLSPQPQQVKECIACGQFVADLSPQEPAAGESDPQDARDVLAFIVNHCRLPNWLYDKALIACAPVAPAPLLAAQKDGQDARRYRWLRKGGYPLCEIDDAAIDAAIQLAGKGDL